MEMEIVFPGGARVDAVMPDGLVIRTNQDGTDPSPFNTFLAAIGTCAGIYVLGFCQQRGLPTEGLRIIQHNNFNPATHLIDNIELDIQLPAGFPEQYKEAVVRSAQLCAVKKHLENPPAFNVHTSMLEGETLR